MTNTSASNPRPSTHTDLAGAVDVDVDVEVRLADGVILTQGEVTLARRPFDGRLAAFGDAPDMWISGALLATLRKLSAPGSATELDFRAAIDEIEAAAVEAAGA
jgi:hypothetical protein